MGKKKKVYFQMFLAYVAILAIPILIGMVIYSYTYYRLNRTFTL